MSNIETAQPEQNIFTGVPMNVPPSETPSPSPFTGKFVDVNNSSEVSSATYEEELSNSMLSATEKEIEKFYEESPQNTLVNDDLLAAGFTQEDIDGYERKLQAKSSNVTLQTNEVMQGQGYPSDIWDAFDTYEDAVNYWKNVVLKDPNVTPPLGVLGYGWHTDPLTKERKYITKPSPNLFSSGAKTDSFDLMATGLAAAAGNAVEGIAAGAEYLGKKTGIDFIGNTVDGITESAGDLLPGVNNGNSGTDAVIAEGTPMLLGGGAAAIKAAGAIPKAPLLVKGLLGLLSGEGANALLSPNDASTLAMGDNSLYKDLWGSPLFNGLELGNEEHEEVAAQRLNILIDGLFVGSGLGAAAKTVVGAGKLANWLVAKPILNATFNAKNAVEQRVWEDITQKILNDPRVATDPVYRQQAVERVAQIVEQNKTLQITDLLDGTTTKVPQDTAGALIGGLNKTDPMDISVEELQRNREIIAGAGGARASAINSGKGPKTLTAANAGENALDDQTNNVLKDAGGETPSTQMNTMQGTVDTLAGQGRDEVLDATQKVRTKQAEYDSTTGQQITNIAEDLENDPELIEDVIKIEKQTGLSIIPDTPQVNMSLADELKRLGGADPTDIDASKVTARKSLETKLKSGYEKLTNIKNKYYDKIKGGQIDMPALLDFLDQIPEETLFKHVTETFKNNDPLKKIFQVTRRRYEIDPETGAKIFESSEVRQDRIAKTMTSWNSKARNPEDADINFGYFYRKIRPELAMAADTLGDMQDPSSQALAKYYREFVDYIDNNMTDYVGEADPALKEAAQEAKAYFRDVYAPIFREGPLGKYSSLFRASRNGSGTDFDNGVSSIISNVFAAGDTGGTSVPYIKQLKELIDNPDVGGEVDDIAHYMLAEVISAARVSLQKTKGTSVDTNSVISTLKQFSEAFNEVYPAQAKTLNKFINKVDEKSNSNAKLLEELDQLKTDLEETTSDVTKGELQNLYSTKPDTGASDPALKNLNISQDPEAALSAMLRENSVDTVVTAKALMKRVNSIEDLELRGKTLNGLRTAFMRKFREKIVGQNRIGGNANILSSNADKYTTERSTLEPIAKILWEDDPTFYEELKILTDIAARISRSKSATPIPSMSATAFNMEAASATGKLINMTVGPLTQTGTRIRSAIGSFVESQELKTQVDNMYDAIMASPDMYVKLSRKYNATPNNPKNRDALLRFFFRANSQTGTSPDQYIEDLNNAVTGETIDDYDGEMRSIFE